MSESVKPFSKLYDLTQRAEKVGISDDDYYLKKLREYIDTLHGVERVEVLPYHDMAKFKYKELGIDYELNDINPPTKDRIKNAIEILGARDDVS